MFTIKKHEKSTSQPYNLDFFRYAPSVLETVSNANSKRETSIPLERCFISQQNSYILIELVVRKVLVVLAGVW